MLGEHYEFVGLMVSLLLKGLLDTGEYFVVGIDTRQYDPKDPQKYLEGMFLHNSHNRHQQVFSMLSLSTISTILIPIIGLFQRKASADSIRAFQSFIGIAPAPPVDNYEEFTKVVNKYLESPPFNFINPYRRNGKMKIVSTQRIQ